MDSLPKNNSAARKYARFMGNKGFDGKEHSQYFIGYKEPEKMILEEFKKNFTNNTQATSFTKAKISQLWGDIKNNDK